MDDMTAYAQSKLAITIWTKEMARKHATGPVFISINPGSLLATKMVKEGFGIEGKNINIGADILVKAAIDDEFLNNSGGYYNNDIGSFSSPHQLANDKSYCEKLMAEIYLITKEHIK
jgi:NAD(P)-dependent dehydrogenase (short-subunit alcohol dehydrogenase family)